MGKSPHKYKKEFCEKLIDHMEAGYSFESFAGVVGVSRACVYKWVDTHEEFKEAKKIAFSKCQLKWERLGIEGLFMGGKDNPFNSTVWVFNMKNRFGWRDKQELSGDKNAPLVFNITQDQADAIVEKTDLDDPEDL